jgi:hypothetical protein
MSAENSSPVVAILAEAEQILSEFLGGDVRLEPGENLDERTNVMRCVVSTQVENAPVSVIVKSAGRPDWPYDPEDVTPHSAAMYFFLDWLGVQFLSALPVTPPTGPRFYGGNRTRGFFIMEDLGSGESLAGLLLGNDAERAEQGLLSFAVALGRMHATTIGRKDAFEALCAKLNLTLAQVTLPPQREAATDIEKLREWCDMLGVPPAPGFDAEVEAVYPSILSPGPFLAYTHGDPCPDNNRLTPAGLRQFDFEHGAFRHALYDGVYGRLPFPTCWCVNRLPPHIPAQMEAAYRAELAATCPEASDDTVFYREAAAVCAFWLLTTMAWGLTKTLQEDQRWGISSLRQRYPMRLHNFADTAESWGHLKALGRTARDMATQLESLWGEEVEPMPLYPAFR